MEEFPKSTQNINVNQSSCSNSESSKEIIKIDNF